MKLTLIESDQPTDWQRGARGHRLQGLSGRATADREFGVPRRMPDGRVQSPDGKMLAPGIGGAASVVFGSFTINTKGQARVMLVAIGGTATAQRFFAVQETAGNFVENVRFGLAPGLTYCKIWEVYDL